MVLTALKTIRMKKLPIKQESKIKTPKIKYELNIFKGMSLKETHQKIVN